MVLLSDKHPIDLTIGQELPPTFHYAWVILEAAAIQIVETWTPEAEELARESLCRVFEKGLATVFDSKKRHEALLIDLLFESGLDDTITAMSVGASND